MAAMDDSFRVRVEKIFGSLTSSSSSSQPQSSSFLQSTLWSLNDDEVGKREWRGDAVFSDRDDIPCSSSFDDLKRDRTRRRNFRRELEEDLDELDDDEGESNTVRRRGAGSDSVDEWDIRSSIGLDSTLDNEEEEDEYDKVASGRENAGERLYMKTFTDQESYLNIHNVLPKSFCGAKDPRADRLKAKVRLQEDESEARKQNSNYDYDTTEADGCCGKLFNENGPSLRSILKRKDSSSNSKPNKRVRFDPNCKVVCEEEDDIKVQDFSPVDFSLPSMKSEDEYEPGQISYFIPDYLCNPSKYTCYSLNSSGEVEEKSSTEASVDFPEPGKSLESSESESELKDVSTDVSKPVVFIRKKKACEVNAINSSNKVEKEDGDQSSQQNGLTVSMAAGDSHDFEDGLEQEDSETNNTTIKGKVSQKATLNYRTKSGSDESDS